MNESILFKSDLSEVGEFTISPADAMFSSQGYINAPIIVFPKTSIWIQHDGSKPFVSDPSLVNFYNQGQVYQRYAISELGDICHWFHIEDEVLSEMVNKENNYFDTENTPCPAAVFMAQLELIQQLNNGAGMNVLGIEEKIIAMYQGLFTREPNYDHVFRQNRVKHQRLVEQVKATLHDDLSANVSLKQLAQIHHTSPFHLSRVFKSVNGEGINQYRKRQRLHLLSLELGSNDLIELAFKYGFSSHSHMSASFKSTFGLTPSQARDRILSH